MNASDVVKAKQNRVLFQAYYRPTIFPGLYGTDSTLIASTTTFESVSSIYPGPPSFISSSCSEYLYTCNQPSISYALLNDVNSGKYLCQFPYCSSISIWNTGTTFPTGTCNCKISKLEWKNTNPTVFYTVSTAYYSSIETVSSMVTSTIIMTGPQPIICSDPVFYQGNCVNSECCVCKRAGLGVGGCCGS